MLVLFDRTLRPFWQAIELHLLACVGCDPPDADQPVQLLIQNVVADILLDNRDEIATTNILVEAVTPIDDDLAIFQGEYPLPIDWCPTAHICSSMIII